MTEENVHHELSPADLDAVFTQTDPLTSEQARRLIEHYRAKRQKWAEKKAREGRDDD